MLDRTQAPPVRHIRELKLPNIEEHRLESGINVFVNHESDTNAFKIELLAKAGNVHAESAEIVQLGLKLLNEGTAKKNSNQLSSYIDSLGSFLEVSPGFDNSSLSIYGLKKFYSENLQILSEIIYESTFNEKSIEILKEKQLNKLRLNQEKGAYLCSINLRKSLFGGHPYGYHLTEEGIKSMKREELLSFLSNQIQCFDIYISGDLPSDYLAQIEDCFPMKSQKVYKSSFSLPTESHSEQIRNSKFIQSSIKAGKQHITRKHPDYFKFALTNELFGGFFGSRLMKNIREDKGYTYGIYSTLIPMNDVGYYIISTDVKGDFEKETITEIEKELAILQSKLVSEDELETVKNYMLGSFINSFTHPFAAITKFKSLQQQDINFDFYQTYLDDITNTTAQDILDMAQKHLSKESITWSIVGN